MENRSSGYGAQSIRIEASHNLDTVLTIKQTQPSMASAIEDEYFSKEKESEKEKEKEKEEVKSPVTSPVLVPSSPAVLVRSSSAAEEIETPSKNESGIVEGEESSENSKPESKEDKVCEERGDRADWALYRGDIMLGEGVMLKSGTATQTLGLHLRKGAKNEEDFQVVGEASERKEDGHENQPFGFIRTTFVENYGHTQHIGVGYLAMDGIEA